MYKEKPSDAETTSDGPPAYRVGENEETFDTVFGEAPGRDGPNYRNVSGPSNSTSQTRNSQTE